MVSRDSGIATMSPYGACTTAEIALSAALVISLIQRSASISGEMGHGTPAASNQADTRATAASRRGPERPGRSPMSRSPRPLCLTQPDAGIELATYTTAAIGSSAAAAL